MPKFSAKSIANLESCDCRLQAIFNYVIIYHDCSVLCGHRGKDEQDRDYNNGKSKLKWPFSKHNKIPSQAVDVVPYPIDWDDMERFDRFVKFVKMTAKTMKTPIEYGADWGWDYPHFELA
ncbi:MAG TPA: M15 family peptidase [Dehalococcoidia bacterium]|nr:M15 family peptidase [Dehalococcoidia bacterium]